MSDAKIRKAARDFAKNWKDKGYEKGESQPFWISLLRDVYGVEHPENYITFEDQVHIDHTSFIDGHIRATRILIEQKSINKDLRAPIRQSDGSHLTPFEQAKRYITEMPVNEHPLYVITCNFKSFLIYDMNKPSGEPEEVLLENLETEYYRLSILIDSDNAHIGKETQVSLQAGKIVGLLYDAIAKRYIDPTSERAQRSLNVLCVRFVFCLYAEDSGLFVRHSQFHDYLSRFESRDLKRAIEDLFNVLNTKESDRDPYLSEELKEFPYVNGGLFAEQDIDIPQFNDEIKTLLLTKASDDFNWSQISPTIFGAVFESTLNSKIRHDGGMHYTPISDIHRVIDPLFLDKLTSEFEDIKKMQTRKSDGSINPVPYAKKGELLRDFQEKLSKLTFLDPACGSGNFLTETYISLRRLENQLIKEEQDYKKGGNENQLTFSFSDRTDNPIKVSISQFYGIEVNDFAVTVAKTALWIAESQMMKETESIIYANLDFLPLKTNAHIIKANALTKDWEELIPRLKLTYMMGNPPFLGMKEQSDEQTKELKEVTHLKTLKQMDYVAGWYFKAHEYMKGTNIECAFVSSNSITQGEQALTIWEPILADRIHINFAYRTFVWNSDATDKARVNCVIISFSYKERSKKFIIDGDEYIECDHINQYLRPEDPFFIKKRGKPLCDVPEMTKGAQLIDGGNFMLSKEDYDHIKVYEPEILPYIKQYWNATNLLHARETIYALYLEDCPPNILRTSRIIYERIQAVHKYRATNESKSTRALADRPSHYFQSQAPKKQSLVIPVVSGHNRNYIPICFMPEGMIYTNALFYIDNASLYEMGVLESKVHMIWANFLCGRMRSDFRYSNTIVYNTFPWPEKTEASVALITQTAQRILDARDMYESSSLAELYDPLIMPDPLKAAHKANDDAVMQAYGFTRDMSDTDILESLKQLYKTLTDN